MEKNDNFIIFLSAFAAFTYSKLRVLKKDEDIYKKKDKCFRFLATRGFSMDVIYSVIDEVDWSSFNKENDNL